MFLISCYALFHVYIYANLAFKDNVQEIVSSLYGGTKSNQKSTNIIKKGVTSFSYHQLSPFVKSKGHIVQSAQDLSEMKFEYVKHTSKCDIEPNQLLCSLPAPSLLTLLPKSILQEDRKSTRLNSSHSGESRMPSSA